MAYRLKRTDRSVEKGIRRIACEQIDSAMAALDNAKHAEEAVHDIRTHCKELRGLIRLVRPAFDGYSEENAAFRDIARSISALRDTEVLTDTYDSLMKRFDKHVDRRSMGPIRRHFTQQRKAELARDDFADRFGECRASLTEARERAGNWKLTEKGWDAISGGIAKTYGRARKAAEEAAEAPDGPIYHELRKRLKYHWYHSRLLRNLWPAEMKARVKTAKAISDLLGDHHDLYVFESRIQQDAGEFGGKPDIELVLALASRHRTQLEAEAAPLIGRMLTESPEALLDRWKSYWDIWRKQGAMKNG